MVSTPPPISNPKAHLCGDEDSMDADGHHGTVLVLVLDSDLGLAVGAQPAAESEG